MISHQHQQENYKRINACYLRPGSPLEERQSSLAEKTKRTKRLTQERNPLAQVPTLPRRPRQSSKYHVPGPDPRHYHTLLLCHRRSESKFKSKRTRRQESRRARKLDQWTSGPVDQYLHWRVTVDDHHRSARLQHTQYPFSRDTTRASAIPRRAMILLWHAWAQ